MKANEFGLASVFDGAPHHQRPGTFRILLDVLHYDKSNYIHCGLVPLLYVGASRMHKKHKDAHYDKCSVRQKGSEVCP